MTIQEKEKIENDIKNLKNCVIIYMNGKPKAIETLDLPITYNAEIYTIGKVLEKLEQKIDNQDKIIDIQNKQIQTLREVNFKVIEAIKKNNIVSNINNANLMEAIKDLGGNI